VKEQGLNGILRILLVFLFTVVYASPVAAQDDEPKTYLDGYLKEMVITDFSPNDSTFWTNLVHNRLNFKWYPDDKWSGIVSARTRWYYGDYVELIPNFAGQIEGTEDFFDLSFTHSFSSNSVINVTFDRAYLAYQSGNWDLKLGRQRINWGVAYVWNPNDLFNAYSYVDFDYEERPGADAIRIQYYTGPASSVELAANLARNLDDFTASGRWTTNKWNYDFHAIGGLSRKDIVLGGAWAGNIKGSGFKGEFSMLFPAFDNPNNTAFVGTLTYDYSFRNNLYINASVLYNSNGGTNLGLGGFGDFYFGEQTARNLSPYRHNWFVLVTYPFTPLFSGALAYMVFPGNSAMFVNPSLTYSIVQNLDLALIAQIFYGEVQGDFQSVSQVLNTRIKWSF